MIFRLRLLSLRIPANLPDAVAERLCQCGNCEHCPGQCAYQKDGDVVPEWLRVLVEVGSKTLKVVLEEEDAEELRHFDLDSYEPRQSDRKEQRETRQPDTAKKNLGVATQSGICGNDQLLQLRRHRPFSQRAQRQQNVEPRQPQPLSRLVPNPPRQERGREIGSQ